MYSRRLYLTLRRQHRNPVSIDTSSNVSSIQLLCRGPPDCWVTVRQLPRGHGPSPQLLPVVGTTRNPFSLTALSVHVAPRTSQQSIGCTCTLKAASKALAEEKEVEEEVKKKKKKKKEQEEEEEKEEEDQEEEVRQTRKKPNPARC